MNGNATKSLDILNLKKERKKERKEIIIEICEPYTALQVRTIGRR